MPSAVKCFYMTSPEPEPTHLDPHPPSTGDPDVDRLIELNAGEQALKELEMDEDNTPPPEPPKE